MASSTTQEYPFAARLMWVMEERPQLPLQFNMLLTLMDDSQRLELANNFNYYPSTNDRLEIETLLTEIRLNLNSYGGPVLLQGILAYEGLLELLQHHYRPPDRKLVAKAAIRGGQLEVLQWPVAQRGALIIFEERLGVLKMVPFGRVDVLDFVISTFFATQAASKYFDPTLLGLFDDLSGESKPVLDDLAKLAYVMGRLSNIASVAFWITNYAKVALRQNNMTAVEMLLSRFNSSQRKEAVDKILEDLSPQRLRYAETRPSRGEAMQTLEDYGIEHQSHVLYLLNQGADPDQVLYFGAQTGNLELVQAALQHGATDVDTALDDEAGARYPEVARLLVSKGARSSRYMFDEDFNVTRDIEEERHQRIWLRSSDEDNQDYDLSSEDDYDPRDRYY